jgi:hypothetical protein
MTSVNRWLPALLAVALVGVPGCTTTVAGNPRSAAQREAGHTASGSQTSQDNAAARLAAIDPCSLLSPAQLDQYGLRKRDSGSLAGARTCSWGHAVGANGKGGFVVGPAIWDGQGIRDLNTNGYSVTDVAVGKHPARQAAQPGGDGCFVAIGVTDSARVDVIASGDPGQACDLANQFAKLIEPQLPAKAE